jgi:hypothetical protein
MSDDTRPSTELDRAIVDFTSLENPLDRAHLEDVRRRVAASARHRSGTPDEWLDAPRSVDVQSLAEAGWGVVFPKREPPGVCERLKPLLDLRRSQAGERYREYRGEAGLAERESSLDFLAARGAAPSGPVNPKRVPYYLLLVGDPETIPFRFQYMLDAAYAVGRLHFEERDDYARYAESLVRAQASTRGEVRPVVFAPSFDVATNRSRERLALPVAEALGVGAADRLVGDRAEKAELARVLARPGGRLLLFAASHGASYEAGDPRQRALQGSLVTSDRSGGGGHAYALEPEECFSAGDLDPRWDLAGSLWFLFGCYTAGTPRLDEFPFQDDDDRIRKQIAKHSFSARFPQRLLAHPGGGAAAVLGHVDRTFSSSFQWNGSTVLADTFVEIARMLKEGARVGSATELLNQRYMELAVQLHAIALDEREGRPIDRELRTRLQIAANDARAFVVVGDPAARLP